MVLVFFLNYSAIFKFKLHFWLYLCIHELIYLYYYIQMFNYKVRSKPSIWYDVAMNILLLCQAHALYGDIVISPAVSLLSL